MEARRSCVTATAAIKAFLEAAAQPDKKTGRTWRMVPNEATEEMLNAAFGGQQREEEIYALMWEAAPPFKLDGETT